MNIMRKEGAGCIRLVENEFTQRNSTFVTYHLMHLAQILKEQSGYPADGTSREVWDTGTRWNFENPEY